MNYRIQSGLCSALRTPYALNSVRVDMKFSLELWARKLSHIKPFHRHPRLKRRAQRYEYAYGGKMFFIPCVRVQCFATEFNEKS